MHPRLLLAAVLTALLAQSGCATFDRRFPLADPLWEDPDRQHVEQTPKEYYSPLAWDGVDQTAFFPISQALAVDPAFRSVNVNSMDEVPDSSWWTNRIGLHPMSVEQVRRGACSDEVLPDDPPWTVVEAKPDGQTPGFIVEDASGRRFVLKTDGTTQPYRASMSDVFGSRLYYAAGFHAPCNLVVRVKPEELIIDDDAIVEMPLGKERPMTQEDIDGVLEAAVRHEDGSRRLAASMFVDGEPLGPFTYQGRRRDDPNDVVRHQDRRELRGGKVLASWMNHFDTREQNSLDTFVKVDGEQYVRHHYIDFGDGFGWDWLDDGFTRRFGHSYYFDPKDVVMDFFSLGARKRVWEKLTIDEHTPWIGYFDVEHFDPARWKGGYRNPAFDRMQPDDAAWMARIIARIDGERVRAMLSEADLPQDDEDHIHGILMGRREKILDTWLRAASPLTDFGVDGDRLCFENLAVSTGVMESPHRYPMRTWSAPYKRARAHHLAVPQEEPSGRTCLPLDRVPRPQVSADVPDDDPRRYLVIDVLVEESPGSVPIPPARLHFYDLGPSRGLRLVGIERPGERDARLD